jgi:hypothetical protein
MPERVDQEPGRSPVFHFRREPHHEGGGIEMTPAPEASAERLRGDAEMRGTKQTAREMVPAVEEQDRREDAGEVLVPS